MWVTCVKAANKLTTTTRRSLVGFPQIFQVHLPSESLEVSIRDTERWPESQWKPMETDGNRWKYLANLWESQYQQWYVLVPEMYIFHVSPSDIMHVYIMHVYIMNTTCSVWYTFSFMMCLLWPLRLTGAAACIIWIICYAVLSQTDHPASGRKPET